MKAFTQIPHILFVLVFLPIEIVIAVFHTIHVAIKTIVSLSEGKTLEDIQRQAISEQLGKINNSLDNLEE